MSRRNTSTYGFKPTAKFITSQVRSASETRGFAQSRILTHWEEIAGSEIAAIARPVEVSYGRGGFGATLVLLTTGARAPMIEMRAEEIRARINAVYGYNAITRLRITQTATTGFAEGKPSFDHRPKKTVERQTSPEIKSRARAATHEVNDDGLRAALERLAENVISKG